MNFLACDLGGTKVLLGIFKKEINDESPNLIFKKKYISSEWVSFELILEDFLKNLLGLVQNNPIPKIYISF